MGATLILFVNATKVYEFKAKNFEIKKYLLCLGNILDNVSANSMKKIRMKWLCVRFFY